MRPEDIKRGAVEFMHDMASSSIVTCIIILVAQIIFGAFLLHAYLQEWK